MRAQTRDHHGAIADYSAAINIPKGPPDLVAMARYNRALIYDDDGDHLKAIDELEAVLGMPAIPSRIKKEANMKLERMKRLSDKYSV